MRSFLWQRINWRLVTSSLLVALIISGGQFWQSFWTIQQRSGRFYDSPYTSWLSIDQFNLTPVVFFILLPLLASLPGVTLLANDLKTHFFEQITNRIGLNKTIRRYLLLIAGLGAATIFISLLVNLLAFFLILPNNRPDEFLNSNILVINLNTLLVPLYYQHPLVHALLSILLASVWAGLFSAFAGAISFYVRQRFLAVSASLLLQMGLLISNQVLPLGNQISYVPSDFLRESANANLSLGVVLIETCLLIVVIMVLSYTGGRRHAYW
ncbi:hypothetical protein [Lapidilactobacillus wuchangensis]|uniref:hypothetical protein n=1 Tax=Lapidilactobacillus wuchangensis TaxID=2486001 RepID=UPI000F79B9ED|nr:hypothetical protein [Lapidilactobacillus wuchangensis]